jgi:transglutaminase-like putative cysteine protease
VRVRVGYELVYDCPRPMPMMLLLNIHYTRFSDIVALDHLKTEPALETEAYRDGFGNWCTRLVLPAGRTRLSTDAIILCADVPDEVTPSAEQMAVEALPADALVFLLGSRYCETDRLSQTAWNLFGNSPPGWARVQAICDYVHNAIRFDYAQAYPAKSALNALEEGVGVCRDYTHLAIAFCRCLNIPARYCTGYLGDMGAPLPYGPGDFAAWMEVYLGGQWHIFDPRNNIPRLGRILIARGRDASDVPLTHTFGDNQLVSFKVWTDEMSEATESS